MYLVPADPRWADYERQVAEIYARPIIGPGKPQLPDTSTWGPKFPTWVMRGGVTDDLPNAGDVNGTSRSSSERQLTFAGENAAVPFGYGTDRIGARVINLLLSGNYVYAYCLWGVKCRSVSAVYFNNEAVDAADVHSYDGSQSSPDSWLVTAFAAQSITFTDTLQGFSYSVIRVPKEEFNGGMEFAATIEWGYVYDPRDQNQDPEDDSTWLGTDNPSLCLANFLTDTVYGCGETVDWDSVAAAADDNDEVIGGGKRRILNGWTQLDVAPVVTVRETLRAYASVFLTRRGAEIVFVSDRPVTPSVTYSHSNGDIASFGPVEKRDINDQPTMVEIVYTDTSVVPWRDRSAFTPVLPGETARRLSTVRMNGIHRYSQAYREAVERLNKLILNDLSFYITVFDVGVKHEVGDVILVTLPFGGIESKPMRIVDIEGDGPGLWRLSLREYDSAVYSDNVQSEPTEDDTTLESPLFPPPPDSVVATSEVFKNANGLWMSRGRVVITPPSTSGPTPYYPWTDGYQIQMFEGTTLVHAAYIKPLTAYDSVSYATPPVQDLQIYTVKVRTVSTVGAAGAWAEDNFTADAKLGVPGPVPSISGFEAGGDVYLAWEPAEDADIWRYELRWGATTGDWDSAAMLDRVDSLRYVSKGVLTAGVRRIWVKAIDSIGQYSSGTPPYVDVTITLDPDALQTVFDQFSLDTPVDMVSTRFGSFGDEYYVTEHDATVGSIFTADPLGSNYPNPVSSYQSDATNTYLTMQWDAGVDLTGDWTCAVEVENISGSATITLMLKGATEGSFTEYTTFPAKTTARYAKIKVTGTGEFKVKVGTESVTCYAVTRKENDIITCTGNGPHTVSLAGAYFKYKSITLTPIFDLQSTPPPVVAIIDNIVLDPDGDPVNGFDVYLFNTTTGAQVNGEVSWRFEGV